MITDTDYWERWQNDARRADAKKVIIKRTQRVTQSLEQVKLQQELTRKRLMEWEDRCDQLANKLETFHRQFGLH